MELSREELAEIIANTVSAHAEFNRKVPQSGEPEEYEMTLPLLGILTTKTGELKSIIAVYQREDGSTFGPLALHGEMSPDASELEGMDFDPI